LYGFPDFGRGFNFLGLDMATFKSLEEIEAWKSARTLSKDIYQLIHNGTFARDFPLKDQISRSSGSMMDNIAEGFERGGNREFITFLSYARGSCGEVRSQLYRAHDRNHIADKTFNDYNNEAIRVSKMISGLMDYLITSEMKGFKYNRQTMLTPRPKSRKRYRRPTQ
jgi:four helix bundle protein